jgi:DNA-binding IclR family transcriptional regulator
MGAVRALSETCAGRAMLANLAPGLLDAFAAWARRHTARAPNGDSLAQEITEIRKRGFAVEETPFAPGRAALAFAVCGRAGALAAIAIEGPVVDRRRPVACEQLAQWREIVHSVERLAQGRPDLFAGPFDHLDPDHVLLG